MTDYYYVDSSGNILGTGNVDDTDWPTDVPGAVAKLDSDDNPGYQNGMSWDFSTSSWYYSVAYLQSYIVNKRNILIDEGSVTSNGITSATDKSTLQYLEMTVERSRFEDHTVSRGATINVNNISVSATNQEIIELYDAVLAFRQGIVNAEVAALAEITALTITTPSQINTAMAAATPAAHISGVSNLYTLLNAKANSTDVATAITAAVSGLSIPTVPTDVSAFTNDAGYATSSTVSSAISTAVNNLINSAPGTMDTLGEIAAFITADETTAAALASTVAGKVSTSTTVNGHALTANITLTAADVGALATAPVTSVFGRTGAVTAGANDYTADQIADGTTNRLYTATEKTKLASIATGATAYADTDAKAAALAAALTGLSTSTNSAVTAADTVLVALGKLQAQVSALATSVSVVSGIKQIKAVSIPTGTTGNNVVLANGTFTLNYAALGLSFTKTPIIVCNALSPSGLATVQLSIITSSTTGATGQVNDPVGTILISGSPLQAYQDALNLFLIEPA